MHISLPSIPAFAFLLLVSLSCDRSGFGAYSLGLVQVSSLHSSTEKAHAHRFKRSSFSGGMSVSTGDRRGRTTVLSTAAASTAIGDGDAGQVVASAPPSDGGEATVATSIFNLAKSIIGAGVLSLPSGVAFFADEKAALLPSGFICALFGLVAAYTFSAIGKVCKDQNSKSFQDAWAKTVSPRTAFFISGSITAMCFLASLAYSIIIGDSFTSLFQTFQLPALLSSRPNVILLLSSLVLYPLCSLKSLNSLAPFSLLGLGGTLYTAVFMAIRLLDKSYSPGGRFFAQIAASARPSFNQRGGFALNHLTFVLLSMLSTSYIAHYNAPQFLSELKNNTMARFNQVVSGAFLSSIAFFVFIMSVGFSTFGGATAGFVLNNYASSDLLATLARFAIGLALLTGYPFTFSALREGILDLRKLTGRDREAAAGPITVGVLSVVTALALVLKDVGFVVSISGAMFGCLLMFIVPAIMTISNIKKSGQDVSRGGKVEIALNYLLMAVGLVMGVLGVSVSTLRQLGKL